MSSQRNRVFLENIVEAIQRSQNYITGMDFKEFLEDTKRRMPLYAPSKLSERQQKIEPPIFEKLIPKSLGKICHAQEIN